jgi:hypothetical protein
MKTADTPPSDGGERVHRSTNSAAGAKGIAFI